MPDARRLAGAALADALRDARARSLALTDDLSDAQWLPPPQPGVNPVAWELGHLAWFAEFWVLRGPHRVDGQGRVHAAQPARHAGPDAHLDSSLLAHGARWTVELPSRARLRSMLDDQLDATLGALARIDGDDDAALYFHRLALLHEDMHAEALTWMRAALGAPAPAGAELPALPRRPCVAVPAADVRIGWPAERRGFAFDNERAAHRVALPAFEIDATPVSAGEFLRFVEAGGYDEPACWPGAAGVWRAQSGRSHPVHWRHDGGGWQTRWFDRWLPLVPEQPVIHVNAWEAEAWCRWAGRRLPRAAEWEHAAATAGLHWGGGVWEWTADTFMPYPGFEPGPYRDYSAPWFGTHRELRGAAFATAPRMLEALYRNFFLPERCDLFSGFRSAALDR